MTGETLAFILIILTSGADIGQELETREPMSCADGIEELDDLITTSGNTADYYCEYTYAPARTRAPTPRPETNLHLSAFNG